MLVIIIEYRLALIACHHSNGGAASETLIVHGVYLHNRGVQHHRKATYREH